jgi:hypothetical protein
MYDHQVAFGEAICHDSVCVILGPHDEIPGDSSPTFDNVDGPPLPATEERADGHPQGALAFPHHDAHFDGKPIAKVRDETRIACEFDDDVDALFVDSQCRHLGETRRFHESHAARQ